MITVRLSAVKPIGMEKEINGSPSKNTPFWLLTSMATGPNALFASRNTTEKATRWFHTNWKHAKSPILNKDTAPSLSKHDILAVINPLAQKLPMDLWVLWDLIQRNKHKYIKYNE